MSGKTLNTRIQNRRGTTAEWATGTAPNFVPKDGEIVAYTDVHRVKIGDGTTKVSDLPFVDKVRDVTLDGESIVNADGVVELHPTAMTDGYVPVWNNTTKVFEDGIKKTNIVTLDTDQSIGGHKTFDTGFTTTARAIFNSSAEFNEDLTLACPIMISNSAGTSGQVLTSQGDGKAPAWKDVSMPSNMVTTDANQTITGSKIFQGGIELNQCSAVFANVANSGSANYIIDCYENSGNNDSLFAVKALGQDKGQVLFGDGTVDCSINFGEGSYITSDMLLCPTGGKTAYPQTKATKSYVSIKTSASAGTFYYDGYIVRAYSNTSPSNINLPTSSGTLALTNQIPIKTATLSGTTLSITLG